MNRDIATVIPGSLQDNAQRKNMSLAESFLSAEVIIIVDTSGSMEDHDARGGRRRYDVACEELTRLQAELPGKVAVIAFSSHVLFVPGGVPPFLAGGTDLAAALEFVLAADGTVRFIVISDGQPNDGPRALSIARKMTSRIDTIFVGPEMDLAAQAFLRQLAQRGGQSHVAEFAGHLAEKIETLLLAGA